MICIQSQIFRCLGKDDAHEIQKFWTELSHRRGVRASWGRGAHGPTGRLYRMHGSPRFVAVERTRTQSPLNRVRLDRSGGDYDQVRFRLSLPEEFCHMSADVITLTLLQVLHLPLPNRGGVRSRGEILNTLQTSIIASKLGSRAALEK